MIKKLKKNIRKEFPDNGRKPFETVGNHDTITALINQHTGKANENVNLQANTKLSCVSRKSTTDYTVHLSNHSAISVIGGAFIF